MKIKVGITSLGCAKNLVDSEIILGHLKREGLDICDELDEARVIIVNTCSFIKDAEDEAEEVIGQLLELKRRGEIEKVIVAGCLPSRYGLRLADRFPEVDYFLAPNEIPSAARIVSDVASGRRCESTMGQWSAARDGWFLYDHHTPRVRLSPAHYAYLKIGEGCNNRCSYCLIPVIKGDLRSRAMDSILSEARALAAEGVREINLISQDTTSYGTDLCGDVRLLELLERLCGINGLHWIRVLYGHPAYYDRRLLSFIARAPQICNYIDFPLQHVNDRLLKAMNRRMTKALVVDGLNAVRELIPGVTVRTTFIVGYPGEGEDEFRELLDFVREARFEHLGAFIYSREEGTPAARCPGQVPHEVKRERFHRLMKLQQEIVREANDKMLGKVREVIIDERLDEGSFSFKGRTEGDAPEVDGGVYMVGDGGRPGEFVSARVIGVMDYDLVGEIV